jgi:plasmid maintenance system antidote protein VapI
VPLERGNGTRRDGGGMEEQVSGSSGSADGREAEEFARLLQQLKDRSGLSYGALATRLHMSTSTLHRYCHGTAVPTDYAPVERLARLCRATPQELVELHRAWILADAQRGVRAEPAAPKPDPGQAPLKAGPVPPSADPAAPARNGEPAAGSGMPGAAAPGPGGRERDPAGREPAGPDEPVVVRVTPHTSAPRRRRTAIVTSAAVAAVLVAAGLAVAQPWNGGGDNAGDQRAAGSTVTTGPVSMEPTATPSTSGPSRTPSTSPAATRPTSTGTTGTPGSPKHGAPAGPTGGSQTTGSSDAVPFTVRTRPYDYDDEDGNPCSQHFLVNSPPGKVGPPAAEADAQRWAAANSAVSAGEQRVALTVQGTGPETVVLESLHVNVVASGEPLPWNVYAMGDGCGGPVDIKSFDIDLDKGSPSVGVTGGQRDFPYSVSESDPEVFYVVAHTTAHDVRWQLTMDWSSGKRSGTMRIDDDGTPFRTSAETGRPHYVYPLGETEWVTPLG